MKTHRIVGINFDHFHMGDLLRMAAEHPHAEVVGICDEQPERMQDAKAEHGLADERVFTDHRACIERAKPDLVILCPSAATHGEWVERVAEFEVPILMEKPFAASLAEADRMIATMKRAGQPLAINWPLRWYPSHAAAFEFIKQGGLGEVIEVHYYDGNRGPLYHGAHKVEKEPTAEAKRDSWFYHAERGGGSLLDYLGYGTTLASWFNGGQVPLDVTCMTGGDESLDVDEHSITIARYPGGRLSKFETRWGTFTDPWTHQPQPKCGFVIRGSAGTLASYDGETHIRVQTHEHPDGRKLPAPALEPPFADPIQYFLHCLDHDQPVEGPLSVALSRIGQQIVDTAAASAREGRTLPLFG